MEIKTPKGTTIYSSPFIDAKITFSPALGKRLDATFGLYSPVQKWIDQEFMNQIKPYMPFKTGTLQNLMIRNTVIGAGVNVTKAPYAAFVYGGLLMVYERTDPKTGKVTRSAWSPLNGTKVLTDIPLEYHGGGKSGPKWDERWAAENLPAFTKSIQMFVDRGAK